MRSSAQIPANVHPEFPLLAKAASSGASPVSVATNVGSRAARNLPHLYTAFRNLSPALTSVR